jgi:hypothetical protein
MTDDEKRIAIAEFDGKCTHHPNDWEHRGPDGDSELFCNACGKYLHDVRAPDYLTDFKAVHRVVDKLDYEDYQMFCLLLGGSVREESTKEWIIPAERLAINATARQRAEALILTIVPNSP